MQHRRSSQRTEGRFFTAFVLPAADGHWRFSAVASKRVGGAVQRNRAKRRLRAAFAQARANLAAEKLLNDKISASQPLPGMPLGVVLYAKLSTLKADFQELVANLQTILRRAMDSH